LIFLNLFDNESIKLSSVCNIFAFYNRKIIISSEIHTYNSDKDILLITIPKPKILPTNLWNLSNLTGLDLSGIQLTTLPPEIGKLSNLTKLNLGYNQLTTLPPEIGKLSNLTGLDLSSNQLTTLLHEIWKLSSLTVLDLCGNLLTALPPEISNLSNLSSLDLSKNPILSLPKKLKPYLLQLKEFKADMPMENYYNPLMITEIDWSDMNLKSVPPEIRNLSNLTSLGLSTDLKNLELQK